jgi:hypothetical protein
MSFPSVPLANTPAAPVTAAPASVPSVSSVPLARRFPLNPTISAKIDYYDLAQTRRAPHDLRSAAIFLCLCAHDNSVWFEPRAPDHRDGEDAPPLPPVLNFAEWLRYIREWQNQHLAFEEEDEIISLAIRLWTSAHATVVIPETGGGPDTKKNANPPAPTGLSSTSTSSPEETSPGATTSSTASPCAPPMPSSTHGSDPNASPASAPQSPPAAMPK